MIDAAHGSIGFMVLTVFLMIAVAIAWILLPFAIFGTKPILRDLLHATRENRELTRELLDRLGPPTVPAEQLPPETTNHLERS